MNKPREFWISKEDAEPYEYNPLPIKPDADKIHNFVHVREVMPNESSAIPSASSTLLTKVDRLTRALERAKLYLQFQCDPNKNSLPVYLDPKDGLEEIEAIERGDK
jgi:hypothetical protein